MIDFNEYTRKGGPVPQGLSAGSIGAAFWRAYIHGYPPRGLQGKSGPTRKAFLAGLARRAVEPGLKYCSDTPSTPNADPGDRRDVR